MKKLLTFAFTALLGASLAFAQYTGGSSGKSETGKKPASGKKVTKAHKGGKKGKKSSSGGTTQPPK